MTLIGMVTDENLHFATNEKLVLTLASCILMAHGSALSPQDAVLDVIQVYKEVKNTLAETNGLQQG